MGEKKQKEAAQKKWKKILFVIAAIMFVVVMVVSSTGMNWIKGIAPVRAGDKVQLDYTVYDASGNPLVTSSEQVYTQQYKNGRLILYTPQLTLTANQSSKQAIYPIKVYIGSGANSSSWQEFALYNPEINAISSGVVGMKASENKHVVFASNKSLNALFTPEDLKKVNVDVSSLNVGDSLSMGVSDTTEVAGANATTYMRMGQITRKSDSGVIVDFGYPDAEITVNSFSSQ